VNLFGRDVEVDIPPFDPGPGDCGDREPRAPFPTAGAGAAALDEPG